VEQAIQDRDTVFELQKQTDTVLKRTESKSSRTESSGGLSALEKKQFDQKI